MTDEKKLVRIYLPVSRIWWDAWLPCDLQMGQVFELLGSLAAELSGGLYRPNGDTALCDYDTGLIYKVSDTVADAGIMNGSKLILF